jgi:hypothetical protein
VTSTRSGRSSTGVDYAQWVALTIVALKLDLRGTAFGRSAFNREVRAIASLLAQLAFYTLVGAGLSAFIWLSPDLFLVSALTMGYVMLAVGLAVLLDHNTAISSPLDYAILGFRPINSRTYFAVRLTNVLVYTTAVTTMVAWLPALTLTAKYGPRIGAVAIASIYAAATATTLAMVVAYAGILRQVGPGTVRQALSYVQMTLTLVVYTAPMILGRRVARHLVETAALEKTAGLLLLPPTWFASWVELAAGRTGPSTVLPALAAVVAVGALAGMMAGRLTLDYSEKLAAMTTANDPVSRPPTARWLWFSAGEARAVALLVLSQFRSDQRFRMGVLAILPMTIVYVLIAARDAGIRDPFAEHDGRGFSPIAMALMLFPSMLKMQLTRSDRFRASWIFFVTPADRVKIVRSSIDVVLVFFLLPYLIALAALQAYLVGHIGHVLVHFALLGLLGHFVLQVMILFDPDLPFSQPPEKGRQSLLLFVFTVGMGIISAIVDTLSAELYRTVGTTLAAFGTVIAASAAVDRLTRTRVRRATESMEFLG